MTPAKNSRNIWPARFAATMVRQISLMSLQCVVFSITGTPVEIVLHLAYSCLSNFMISAGLQCLKDSNCREVVGRNELRGTKFARQDMQIMFQGPC